MKEEDVYKTLKVFNGKKYIELAEHQEIIKTSDSFKDLLNNLPNTTAQLKEVLGSLSKLRV